VQGLDQGVRVFLYYCALCDVHKIIFKYDLNKDDLCKVVSTVKYLRKYLEEDDDNWEVGLVDDGGIEDKECL
tara:strand:+ start:147 stop:362 length:216 start_codon:yes stop_codon:yes gene_type:complete